MTNAMPLGYRIVGPCSRERRLVDYDRAFAAYADCDDLAQIEREGFLSPFQYDDAIRSRVVRPDGTLDVRRYAGPHWSRFLWFDIDDDGNIDRATASARRLVAWVLERYQVDESELLVFFSGSKGFHVGLPTSLFVAKPSDVFGRVARQVAEDIAAKAAVRLDTAIYNIVQPLRAPNSRHGKTGRHKRFLTVDELRQVRPAAIVDRSAEPLAFDLPETPAADERAVADWQAACEQTNRQAEAVRCCDNDRTELNRSTLEFIRDGADEGDRHRLLYSAAANLAELGCPSRLAHALLTESALDSGLPPADVRRAINNGLSKGDTE
ncbi:DNA primase [Crateriforma spongiae]|uniref:DNA primase n=1 Tax=Crateriforma spongiae TaxID=2724528 RepID=UPI0014472ACF|nr:DNA primase [Crateriforma spongiae]